MLPKMVRDKVMQEIINSGRECVVHQCSSKAEYNTWLAKKMAEELLEFFENPCVEEAADIYEVFLGLLNKNQIPLNGVRIKAASKREKYGGFNYGIVLHKVVKPIIPESGPQSGAT